MAELSRNMGVSIRTLERSFLARFNCSPTQFLKMLRLNKARRLLAKADPQGATVTLVALGCGFRDLGRFSVEYGQHFGGAPGDTLLR